MGHRRSRWRGTRRFERWLKDRLPGLRFAPMITTCALTGQRVQDLLKLTPEDLHKEAALPAHPHQRHQPAFCEAAVARRRPRRNGLSPTKIYYMTQAESSPPTFIVFVNRTDWMEPGYSRYLENYIRERSILKRVPMRIIFKALGLAISTSTRTSACAPVRSTAPTAVLA